MMLFISSFFLPPFTTHAKKGKKKKKKKKEGKKTTSAIVGTRARRWGGRWGRGGVRRREKGAKAGINTALIDSTRTHAKLHEE